MINMAWNVCYPILICDKKVTEHFLIDVTVTFYQGCQPTLKTLKTLNSEILKQKPWKPWIFTKLLENLEFQLKIADSDSKCPKFSPVALNCVSHLNIFQNLAFGKNSLKILFHNLVFFKSFACGAWFLSQNNLENLEKHSWKTLKRVWKPGKQPWKPWILGDFRVAALDPLYPLLSSETHIFFDNPKSFPYLPDINPILLYTQHWNQ